MNTVVVQRNDIPLEFVATEIKRGKFKGEKYLAPVVDENTVETILKWLGGKETVQLVRAEINKRAQIWTDESIPDEGQPNAGIFQEGAFVDMAKNFSARGETMETLNEQIEELTEKLTELASNTEEPDALPKMKELGLQLKDLRAALAAKKRAPRKSKEEKSAEAVAA